MFRRPGCNMWWLGGGWCKPEVTQKSQASNNVQVLHMHFVLLIDLIAWNEVFLERNFGRLTCLTQKFDMNEVCINHCNTSADNSDAMFRLFRQYQTCVENSLPSSFLSRKRLQL